MKLLHGFNVLLYSLNAGVWYFGAHHVGMALVSLAGIGVACALWKFEL